MIVNVAHAVPYIKWLFFLSGFVRVVRTSDIGFNFKGDKSGFLETSVPVEFGYGKSIEILGLNHFIIKCIKD